MLPNSITKKKSWSLLIFNWLLINFEKSLAISSNISFVFFSLSVCLSVCLSVSRMSVAFIIDFLIHVTTLECLVLFLLLFCFVFHLYVTLDNVYWIIIRLLIFFLRCQDYLDKQSLLPYFLFLECLLDPISVLKLPIQSEILQHSNILLKDTWCLNKKCPP